MRFIFIFILFVSLPLLSYTPGKWSYKDQLILYKVEKGPSKEIIRNTEGTVIYVSEFTYDENGHLLQETYTNKEGKPDGKTIYVYKDGMVIAEEVYGPQNNLVEKKEFFYKVNLLKRLVTKDETGKVQIQYNLTVDKDGSVIAGEGKNAESNDLESFKFSIDSKRPNVQIQSLLDDKKRSLGEIHFKYDAKGHLAEREFFQGETKRVHKLKYKTDGSLESFTFHVKQGDTWMIDRTHTLIYDETLKNKVSKKD